MLKSVAAFAVRRLCSSNSAACIGPKFSNITRVWFTPLPKDTQWIAPCRMFFIENGETKYRDMIRIKNFVLVIIYNKLRKRLIFVRQFRPAVYHSIISGNTLEIPQNDVDLNCFPPELGITLEPVGGLVDKDKSLAAIARDEVLEESGYDVPENELEAVSTCRSGVGTSSCDMTVFYCEVSDEQKVSKGGGVGDEVLEIVELSIDEAKKIVRMGAVVHSGVGTLISLLWFLGNKI